MNWVVRFFTSSIGCKILMALTGLALFGFVLGHLAGNLTVYGGPGTMNAYAKGLRDLGPMLWILRCLILAVAVLHILSALRLTRLNRAARPVAYVRKESIESTAASRSMMLTGATVLAYVVFHLAHLTWGTVLSDYAHHVDAEGRHDVYFMVVMGFKQWWITALYVVAMVVLGVHLRHGISSFFQTLGLHHVRYNALIEKAGPVLAVLIVIGYLSIPISVLTGLVTLAGGAS
jgi:succinate dehydrogenase / fumarate reductase cytochrome b subunit